MTVIFKAKLMEIEFTENTEAPARISTTMRKLVRSSTLRPPPSGWIKCNVDADFIKTLAGGATAAVFRAHSSNLLTGLNSKIVAGSALAAEALAVKEALIMAKIFQIENIIIESDRVILTQALKPGTSIVEIQPILEDILDIVGSISNCGFTWVPRGWNALAHEVAKLAAVGTFGKNWVTCMPQTINNIVKKERCVVFTPSWRRPWRSTNTSSAYQRPIWHRLLRRRRRCSKTQRWHLRQRSERSRREQGW
ncbi:hypothetical protein S245_051254 [Arachis hypogaea]|uniref:RNase H type-1 domain-containing protein n=1 Tax=Arachis hypogaea TaxID=3818 RepID=A0A444Z8X9_ARAHY|nr:hypothetical protein Ahy_B05g079096 [Arachis hypogaea]